MISHAHKTVFVHIPKTGGQSVETVFLNDLDLAWRDRAVLLLRQNANPRMGPQKLAHLYADEYVALGHMLAEDFDRYLRFAIVRHPYERALSEFRYRAGAAAKRGQVLELDIFLNTEIKDDYSDGSRHLVPQVRYVTDARGRVLVDRVLRFERLAQDIAPVFRKIFGRDRRLPHKNRSRVGLDARLSPVQADMLFERYRADFEAFGYDR
ncbi:sulfotransferase family 2 domain-containing protein [Sedimentitalea todarodis]|uniref:Sulfotransferase family 2 domain-containing protein n=2 Tax=Sedimentitalea todarodis TaxID=1631240 RepID=A0ABU3VHQ8_9RHOB|nr:sulfotransferase family 2 domain-containing protein [Sedimentitalea todarodis]